MQVRTVSQKLLVTWNLPTKRTDGANLALAEIKSTEVATSANNGATYTVLASVPAGQTLSFERDFPDGAYKIRLVVIDTLDQRGTPAIGDFTVKTPPAPPAAPTFGEIKVS